MLRWLALPGLYLALVATATAAKYATYFQCDLATKPGHLFLLVQVFREPQDEKRPDMGMGTFVIRPGETASVVYKNRLYPGREYHFSAHAAGDISAPVVKVETTAGKDPRSSLARHTL